jgi:hypothetical protein
MRRGAGRRQARERAAARPEALPEAATPRERERLLRVVLDGVLTLPEPEREAVLLRHYEALPPRAIAARLGVPVEQVYRRLERAVERLRTRLDAAHEGRRRAWVLGLSGALGLPPVPSAPATSAAAGLSSGKSAAAGATGSSFVPGLGALVMSSSAATVTFVAVGLVAGLGVGWFVGSRQPSEPAPVGERPAGATGDSASAAANPGAARLEGQEPAAKIAALEQENATKQAELVAARQQVKDLEARVEALTPKPVDPSALRFGLPASTPGFDAADWNALATHVVALAKAMPAVKSDLLAGKLSAATMETLQKHNTPLVQLAMSLFKELKGKTPNDAYTHPASIANLIRAVLQTSGDALTPAQEQGIVSLGKAWEAEMEQVNAARGPDAVELAAVVGEVAAKDRFLRGVKALLTPSQRALLWQPDVEDRVGIDIFSPGLVYQMREDGTSPDPAALAENAVKQLLELARIEDVPPSTFAYWGQQWVDALPAAAREARTARDGDVMFPTLATVQAGAQAQLQAMKGILASGKLTPEQAAKLRGVATLVQVQLLKLP